MQTIKTYLCNRFTTLSTAFILTLCCFIILGLRFKVSQSYFMLFLVWNLFLAAIPFCITFYLRRKEKHHKVALIFWVVIWLLFLPNAPYILTDFIHLTHFKANYAILDTLVISAFACTGLYYYSASVNDINCILKFYISEKKLKYSTYILPFLCGFGIYLGRYLRWNSWDILQKPQALFYDILNIIIDPTDHLQAWVSIFTFGFFFLFLDKFYKKIGN